MSYFFFCKTQPKSSNSKSKAITGYMYQRLQILQRILIVNRERKKLSNFFKRLQHWVKTNKSCHKLMYMRATIVMLFGTERIPWWTNFLISSQVLSAPICWFYSSQSDWYLFWQLKILSVHTYKHSSWCCTKIIKHSLILNT